ncbi:BnaAnng27290D, partial [Brassica napus]
MDKKPFSVMFSPIPQQRLDGLTLSPPVVSHQQRKPSDEFLRAVDQDIADFTINI